MRGPSAEHGRMSTPTLPRPRPRAAPQPIPLGPLGQVVLLGALFTMTLDFFIVNVALPSMRRDLGAGDGAVTVWVAGFAVAFSAFLVLGSRLGDLHGRRRVFVAGLAVFTGASALCGLAPEPISLSLGRVIQGLGAALMGPQVLATITATTAGRARERAMVAYGLTAGLAAICGQLVGGALIELDLGGLGWRWCFLVNLPIGVAALVLAPRVVPETRAARRLTIDGLSVGLLAAGLGGLILALAEGPGRDWPWWLELGAVESVVLLALFTWRQHRLSRSGRVPLVDLGLLHERTYGLGTALCLVLQMGIASSFFVLALALQGGLGLDALASGLVFTALALGYVAASFVSPGLVARFGPSVLVAGAGVSAAGEVLLALAGDQVRAGGSVAALLPGLVVAGVGMGLLFAPSVSVALSRTPPARAGEASGVVNTAQQAGNAIGVALLGIVFTSALGASDYAHAFTVASWCLVGQALLIGAIALVLLRTGTEA